MRLTEVRLSLWSKKFIIETLNGISYFHCGFAMSLVSLRNCLGRVWVGFCQKQECKLSLPLLRGMIIYYLFIYSKMDCLHVYGANAIVSCNVNFAIYSSLVISIRGTILLRDMNWFLEIILRKMSWHNFLVLQFLYRIAIFDTVLWNIEVIHVLPMNAHLNSYLHLQHHGSYFYWYDICNLKWPRLQKAPPFTNVN